MTCDELAQLEHNAEHHKLCLAIIPSMHQTVWVLSTSTTIGTGGFWCRTFSSLSILSTLWILGPQNFQFCCRSISFSSASLFLCLCSTSLLRNEWLVHGLQQIGKHVRASSSGGVPDCGHLGRPQTGDLVSRRHDLGISRFAATPCPEWHGALSVEVFILSLLYSLEFTSLSPCGNLGKN